MKSSPTNRIEWLTAMLVLEVIAPPGKLGLALKKAEAFVSETGMPNAEVRIAQIVAESLLHRPTDPCPTGFSPGLYRQLKAMVWTAVPEEMTEVSARRRSRKAATVGATRKGGRRTSSVVVAFRSASSTDKNQD
jgi:hypothetical protein